MFKVLGPLGLWAFLKRLPGTQKRCIRREPRRRQFPAHLASMQPHYRLLKAEGALLQKSSRRSPLWPSLSLICCSEAASNPLKRLLGDHGISEF